MIREYRPLELLLLERLASLGLRGGGGRLGLVAVSGGSDSLALLHLLTRTAEEHHLDLVVGHVDHGIHPQSAAVAQTVADHATRLGLPLEITRIPLGSDASETEAREARYHWLFQTLNRLTAHAGTHGVILTAHQRNDQVETILMRVLRGSGPAGLAGIAQRRGSLVRPLLDVHRGELADYLREIGVSAWEDPANLSRKHLRGWLRAEVVPALRQKLPNVEKALVSLGQQAQTARDAWDAVLDELPLDTKTEGDRVSFASGPVRAYDRRLAVVLFMAMARRVELALGPRRASRALDVVLNAGSGSRADLGQGWVAEVQFDRIAIVRPPVPLADTALEGVAGEVLSGRWRIRWQVDEPPPLPLAAMARTSWTTWVVPGDYIVRGWRPGDRIRPLGGRGSRLVVRCMQDQKVGRSERPEWPIVSIGGEDVVWVPGVCRSELAIPGVDHEGRALRVDVERE